MHTRPVLDGWTIKEAVSWLSSSFCLFCQLHVFIHIGTLIHVTKVIKLLVYDTIKASGEPTVVCVQSILSNFTNNKINSEKLKPNKFSKNTISIRVNLVQVSPSVPSFLLADCSLYLLLMLWAILMAVATVIRDTALLINWRKQEGVFHKYLHKALF